jgi:DNA-binding response OmpR family regulator
MRNKVLALGNEETTTWLFKALQLEGIDVIRLRELPDSLNAVKQENFDMVFIDGLAADVDNMCFKIAWICRLRVAMICDRDQVDINAYTYLGANAFIPRSTPPSDLSGIIQAVCARGHQVFENVRILAIEDDRNIREAIRLGFRIFWPEAELNFADEGQTGLNIIRNKAIDLVLLDLGLPDMSGFDVLAKIRSYSRAPVIILSAARDQGNVIKAIQSGANDYMVKPFKQIELMPRILKYVTMASVMK